MSSTAPPLHLSSLDTQATQRVTGWRLRAQLFSRLLFFEQVMLADSPFNTNAVLRYYLWGGEPTPAGVSAPLTGERDLDVLLGSGLFVPALRSGAASLADVRQAHLARNVPDLPSERFIEHVERRIAGSYVRYDPGLVSALFKARFLDGIAKALGAERGRVPVRKSILLAAQEYVIRQEPLYLNSFMEWLAHERRETRLTDRGARFLDRMARGAFRHNVAIAMDSNLDIATLGRPDPLPVELRLGNALAAKRLAAKPRSVSAGTLPPAVILSEQFLGTMPARLLLEIHALPSFQTLTTVLQRFRDGAVVDLDDLIQEVTLYLYEVDLLVMQETSKRERETYTGLRKRITKGAVLRLIHDVGLVALQVAVPPLGILGNAYQVIHTGWGTTRQIRGGVPNYLEGYIAGRAADRERLLLSVVDP